MSALSCITLTEPLTLETVAGGSAPRTKMFPHPARITTSETAKHKEERKRFKGHLRRGFDI
jgi:hypothetical protein